MRQALHVKAGTKGKAYGPRDRADLRPLYKTLEQKYRLLCDPAHSLPSPLRRSQIKSTSDAISFRFARPTLRLPHTTHTIAFCVDPGSTRATRTAACPTLERRNGRASSASSSWRHGVRGSPAPTTTKPARWDCEIWSCRTLNIELEYGRTELRHGRLRHDLLCRPEPQLHLPHDQGSGAQCEPASCLVLVYL